MSINTIKINQIDQDELLAWLRSILGITSGGNYANSTTFQQDINVVGNGYFNQVFLDTSLYAPTISGDRARIAGDISGSGIYGNTGLFSELSARIINLGAINLTGVPIYDSGQASIAVVLPSGTVYGIKQKINAPQFEGSGNNLMPATGIGNTVVLLCISIGS